VGAQGFLRDGLARDGILELSRDLENLQKRQTAEQKRQSEEQERLSAQQQRLSEDQKRLIEELQLQRQEQQSQILELQRQSGNQQRLIDTAYKKSRELDALVSKEIPLLWGSYNLLSNDSDKLSVRLSDLLGQIEELRGKIKKFEKIDQIARDVSEVQKRLNDFSTKVEDRLRSIEPAKVSVDGRDFLATPDETKDFNAALAFMNPREFAQAQKHFTTFVRRYPGSHYRASALFRLGTAQYFTGNYKESLDSLRAMLAESSDHELAPDAMLTVANALKELKEPRDLVLRSLRELVDKHPNTKASHEALDLILLMESDK
jgi:TolA-binding protein